MTNLTDALREIKNPPTQEQIMLDFAKLCVAENRWQPMRDDAEFSDLGRSPRFPPGWWIIPALLFDVVLIGGAVWWLT